MYGKIDGTFLGIISITVRSSTNLARGSQRRMRSLTITANSIGPRRVPWGMPPFNLEGGEEDVAILTTCDLASRNDAIHLNKQGWTSNNFSLSNKIRRATRSKPFLKSTKNHLTQQFPLSSASSVRCRRYTIACCVAFPAIANCLGSRRSVMPGRTLESVNPSIILAVWQVREMGRTSHSMLFGGLRLGRGQTTADLRREGRNPCLIEVLYSSARIGESSNANILRIRLGMQSGPGALLVFNLRRALNASCDDTKRFSGTSGSEMAESGLKLDVKPVKNSFILQHRVSMLSIR